MTRLNRALLDRLKFGNQSGFLALMGPLLLCVWGFVGGWSWWEHSTTLASNALVMEQLAEAVQAQTKGLFNQAESTLIVARHWIEAHPEKDAGNDPEFVALIDELRKTSYGVMDLRLVTVSGELLFVPSKGQVARPNVSDRDYFRAQFDNKNRGFFVGEPVIGRLSKKVTVPISMPVNSPRSRFSMLTIAMEVDRIAGPFEKERIKPSGTIGIVRSDGIVLLRSPQSANAIGRSIATGQAWAKYMGTMAKGSYESEVSLFDQLPRIVSFSRVENYPLVVYVSASKNAILAPWKLHTAILMAVAALISLISFLMIRTLLSALNTSRISQAIVQSTDEAVIGESLGGIINRWNPGAERMFGYSALEMVGQSILRLLPPDRQNEEALILERIQDGQTVQHFDSLRVRKDGRIIHVSATISPIRDAKGRLIGASKIARDITAQKEASRQLQLTASVFTNASEGIFITDRRGAILEVNEAFTRITGYNRENAIGKNPQVFRSSQQGPEVFKAIHLGLIRHGEWRGELWNRRLNGDSYSAWLTISTVRDSRGKVQNYVALFSDVTAMKLQQETLEHGAHYDVLTDLPNRLLLSDRLQQAMTMCHRHNRGLAVLFLDLDGFKSINDRHGHKVGDELLIALSSQMKAALRDVDTLARMGGDEFVAVLTDVEDIQDCLQTVNRLLEACACPVLIQGLELRVTASVGVTLYPQDNAEAEQLMRHADQAMYQAKQSGKNRFHLFDSAQDAEVRSRTFQQELIAQGLARQEFVLFYQPKVNMRTGAIIGVEALIRWQHPDKGLLPPSAFLPAVEQHALNETIGSWVVGAALKQMTDWKVEGLTIAVSVNIGARQLQSTHFAGHLSALLSNYPAVSPEHLELEVLETSALNDINSTASIMEDCHRLGVRFALDDFGTGYSSLTYLRHLPVETLKIDQSFVRNMLEDRDDLSIVKGVIGLASAFHKDVIAEGVETDSHGTRLIELGCDHAQGYGIARPMPADQVAAWCSSWRPPEAWARAVEHFSLSDSQG
ncbi:MAG: EAL domain-containing protein [Rhodoferax sp.]|uniref:bifunctional diguanylate cyclase/phosphodiesterase n=1 Tax=Rhodoferax sp. TaxID=50421 RepID=UPI00261068FC|nr:EAL domain-containing protein [Rhodoferax sp.]MDD2880993.1 EAL domain-containing protein [Rhodoferax sp.]